MQKISKKNNSQPKEPKVPITDAEALLADPALLDVFSAMVKPETMTGLVTDPIFQIRIIEAFPERISETTVKDRCSILLKRGLINKSGKIYSLSKKGITLAENELATEINRVAEELLVEKSKFAEMSPQQRANYYMSKHKSYRVLLIAAYELSEGNPDYVVRINPLSLRIDRKYSSTARAVQSLQKLGLIDYSDRITEIGRTWVLTEGQTSSSPTAEKTKKTKVRTIDKKALNEDEDTTLEPIEAVTVASPISELKMPPKKARAVKPKREQESEKPAANSPKKPRKVTEKEIPVVLEPTDPPAPAKRQIKPVNTQMAQQALEKSLKVAELGHALASQYISATDRKILREMPFEQSLVAVKAADTIGLLRETLSRFYTNPEQSFEFSAKKNGALTVRIPIQDPATFELFRYLATREAQENSIRPVRSTAKELSASPHLAGPEKLCAVFAEDTHGLLVDKSRIFTALLQLRDELGELIPEKTYFKRSKQIRRNLDTAKSNFTSAALTRLNLTSLDDSRSQTNASSVIGFGVKVVKEIINSSPDNTFTALLALSIFGAANLDRSSIEATVAAKQCAGILGVQAVKISKYSPKPNKPVLNDLSDNAVTEGKLDSFYFEDSRCPGVALHVSKFQGDIHRVDGICISSGTSAVQILEVAKFFHQSKLNLSQTSDFPSPDNSELLPPKQFRHGTNISSSFALPVSQTSEVIVTNATYGHTRTLQGGSYLAKLRFLPDSRLIYASEAEHASSVTSRSKLRHVLRQVSEHNIRTIDSALGEFGGFEMSIPNAEAKFINNAFSHENNFSNLNLQEAAAWYKALSNSIQDGRLNPVFLYPLANHPHPQQAGKLLESAQSLTILEQGLEWFFESSGMKLSQIYVTHDRVELRLSPASESMTRYLDAVAAYKEKNTLAHKDFAAKELASPLRPQLGLAGQLAEQLSPMKDLPKALTTYQQIAHTIQRDLNHGRLSSEDAFKYTRAALELSGLREKLGVEACTTLAVMSPTEISTVLNARYIFGRYPSREQLILIGKVLNLLTVNGFLGAELRYLPHSLGRDKNLGNKIAMYKDRSNITDGMPYPSSNGSRIFLADNLQDSPTLSSFPASAIFRSSTYAIDIMWKSPRSLLQPKVKAVYITENMNPADLQSALLRIHQTLQNVADNKAIDIISALNGESRDTTTQCHTIPTYSGEMYAHSFDQMPEGSSGVWLTNGNVNQVFTANNEPLVKLRDETYLMLVKLIEGSELYNLRQFRDRSLVSKRPLSSGDLDEIRAAMQDICKHNVEKLKKYVQK